MFYASFATTRGGILLIEANKVALIERHRAGLDWCIMTVQTNSAKD